MKLFLFKILDTFLTMHVEPYTCLLAFSFMVVLHVDAQANPGIASATVSATVTTEMAGVEKIDDINFENINPDFAVQTITTDGGMNIIGNNNAYSITLSSSNIIVKRNDSNETMIVSSFQVKYPGNFKTDSGFGINAVVNKNSSRSAGIYTSMQPLLLTVNYN